MARIAIKGPITEVLVDTVAGQDQAAPKATFDDILEEGSTFPNEEEATQNLIAGEAEQASVKLVPGPGPSSTPTPTSWTR